MIFFRRAAACRRGSEKFYPPSLYPSQMPAIPPTAERRTEDAEKMSEPQSIGSEPPIVEPMKSPIHIKDFLSIFYANIILS